MYYIYHIPGEKVGCTKNWKIRTWSNKRQYGKDIEMEVLQVVSTVEEADVAENNYSIRLGYGEIPSNERYIVRSRVGKTREGVIASAETREKLREARVGKKATKETKAKLRETNGGKNNGNYGRRYGKVVIELTTGFTGTVTDHVKKFGIDDGTLYAYAKRGTMLKKGRNQGLHFVFVEPTSM